MTQPIYQTFCTEDDPIRQDFWMDVSQEAYEHLKDKEGVRCRVVYPGAVPTTSPEPTWQEQFIAKQEPLGAEFSKVLADNLPDLYMVATSPISAAGEKALAGVSVPDVVVPNDTPSKAVAIMQYAAAIEALEQIANILGGAGGIHPETFNLIASRQAFAIAEAALAAAPKEAG